MKEMVPVYCSSDVIFMLFFKWLGEFSSGSTVCLLEACMALDFHLNFIFHACMMGPCWLFYRFCHLLSCTWTENILKAVIVLILYLLVIVNCLCMKITSGRSTNSPQIPKMLWATSCPVHSVQLQPIVSGTFTFSADWVYWYFHGPLTLLSIIII